MAISRASAAEIALPITLTPKQSVAREIAVAGSAYSAEATAELPGGAALQPQK